MHTVDCEDSTTTASENVPLRREGGEPSSRNSRERTFFCFRLPRKQQTKSPACPLHEARNVLQNFDRRFDVSGQTHHLLEAVADVCDPLQEYLLGLDEVAHGAREHHAASVAPHGRRPGVLLDLHLRTRLDVRNGEMSRRAFVCLLRSDHKNSRFGESTTKIWSRATP